MTTKPAAETETQIMARIAKQERDAEARYEARPTRTATQIRKAQGITAACRQTLREMGEDWTVADPEAALQRLRALGEV